MTWSEASGWCRQRRGSACWRHSPPADRWRRPHRQRYRNTSDISRRHSRRRAEGHGRDGEQDQRDVHRHDRHRRHHRPENGYRRDQAHRMQGARRRMHEQWRQSRRNSVEHARQDAGIHKRAEKRSRASTSRRRPRARRSRNSPAAGHDHCDLARSSARSRPINKTRQGRQEALSEVQAVQRHTETHKPRRRTHGRAQRLCRREARPEEAG